MGYNPYVDESKKKYTYRDMGKLGRVLDFIQRPSYFVQNILEEMQDPERHSASEIFAPINPAYKSRRGLWKLPEEVKGRGRDLWEDAEGMPEWGKTIAGLGTEIVTDPTTWLTMGGATAGAKALRAAGTFTKLGRLGQAQKSARAALGFRIPGLMKNTFPLVRGVPYFKAEAKLMKALNPVLKYVSKTAWLDSLPTGVREAMEHADEITARRGKEMARVGGEVATGNKAAREAGWSMGEITRMMETAKGKPWWGGQIGTMLPPEIMPESLRNLATNAPRRIAVSKLARKINPNLPSEIVEQVATKYDEFSGLRQAFFQEADVLLSKYAPEEAEAIAEMWVRHIATDNGLKQIGKVVKGTVGKGKPLSPKLQQFRDFLYGWAASPEGAVQMRYPQVAMPAGQAAKRLVPMGYDQIFRKIARGQGIYEINKAARQLGLGTIFEENLSKIATTVMGDTMKIVKKGHYLKRLATTAVDTKLAVLDEEEALAKGYKLFKEMYPDVVKRTTGETKDLLSKLYFDPQHIDEVAHVVRQYSDPKQVRKFLKHYDNMIGVWKAWTLGPFIPYHVRNDFSDIAWFNFLAGVGSENYPIASRVMKELGKRGEYGEDALKFFTDMPATPFTPFSGPANVVGKLKQAITGGAVDDATISKLADDIMNMDLLHKGQHIEAGGLRGAMLKPLKKPVEFGGIREDWGRISHAVDRLRKGWAGNEVYADVMKYHYNYSIDALTPFERFLPNRMFFFYRWARNNLPGSVRNLFEHYGKHTAVAKGIAAVEQGLPTWQEKYMPEWMKERGAIQMPDWVPLLGGKKTEPKYFMTEAWWPFAEVAGTLGSLGSLKGIGKEFGERLAPPFKIPTELITGQEIFYDKPIELYEGQRKKLLGMNMPAHIAYLMRQSRGVTEIDRTLKRMGRVRQGREKAEEVAASAMFGAKSYHFSPEREASQRFFETIRQMGIIKSALKRADQEGDYRLSRHLTNLLEQLSQQQVEYRQASGI